MYRAKTLKERTANDKSNKEIAGLDETRNIRHSEDRKEGSCRVSGEHTIAQCIVDIYWRQSDRTEKI